MGRKPLSPTARKASNVRLCMSDESLVVLHDAMAIHNISQIKAKKTIVRTFSEFVGFCAGIGAKDIKAANL